MVKEASIERAKAIFRGQGGILRTSQAIALGIHPRTLYAMRDAGELERLSRGLYRLASLPPPADPDLLTVSLKVSSGVVCLISALSYHELTTEIPHEVYLALRRGAEPPRLDHPPLRVFWFSGLAFSGGVEQHDLDGGAVVKVYSPEKTLADCFKYRNKIGLDTVLEALRTYRRQRPMKIDALLRYAQIDRVENVMRPYLEALL